MKPERRTMQEQAGRAINASHLEHRDEREMPIETIGGIGAAALHVHHGADFLRRPVASVISDPGHAPDPQNVLAAELASCLWHIEFAGQFDAVPKAVRLFSEWMVYRGRFNSIPDIGQLLPRLAARVIHELLSPRCIACGGSGKLEKSRSGSWIRPRGSMQRNATFRTCGACEGSRRQAISHTERRIALDITRQRYDEERWDTHFKAALTWLDRNIGRLNRPLTVQLERSKKRE
jgi:hypothetical protein